MEPPVTTTTPLAVTSPSTTPSADPDIETPSTGELNRQSDCLFSSQGAAIATITFLAVLVVILFTTNAVTLLYLRHRDRLYQVKHGSTYRDTCDLDLTKRGVVNKSFEPEDATVVSNQWTGIYI